MSFKLKISTVTIYLPKLIFWYNNHIESNKLALRHLPCFEQDRPLGLLIGNTKTTWYHFIQWLSQQQDPLLIDDPFDTYIKMVIESTVKDVYDLEYEIFWVNDYSPDRLVSMQRVGNLAAVCRIQTVRTRSGAKISF